MPADRPRQDSTLALNTKVEDEFVAPLTVVRGALEILRDFPELTAEQRESFVERALQGCAKLERGVEELAASVYAAAEKAEQAARCAPAGVSEDDYATYAGRVHVLEELGVIEIDFSDFQFSSAKIVNDFYDVIDDYVETSRQSWYFLVNYRECRVWPEAWVAFAHRGKKVNVTYSLGTVRYVEQDGSDGRSESQRLDPDMFTSRDAALARIAEMRREAGHGQVETRRRAPG